MYQPEPTAYLQVSTGYAMPHTLPEYTFDETPLRLSDGRGGSSIGAGGSSSSNAAATSALLYGTPLFSNTNSAGIGPAPPTSGSSTAPAPAHSHTFHHQQQQQHHQHPPQQHRTRNVARTVPSSVAASSSRIHQHPHQQHHRASLPILLKMEPNSEDIAAQEAAAREYQQHFEGPLIGKKTPSTAIVEEYAKADPIYVQKTMVLPQTYSDYRPVQGDGSCGWRAIGFGYFEALIKTRSKARIDAERQRLESLTPVLENVGGFPSYLLQDFVDETFSLLQKLADLANHPDQAMSALEEVFNTPDVSSCILYHLRMLASSYLKGNQDQYAAFVTTNTGVEGYCKEVLEHHNVELDHLGLTLLVNVLLRDAGFVLEVAYLDRSPGSEVNTYRFPEEANGRHPSELGPIIHLLFRPDHYDILYIPEPVDLQVHRVASFSHRYEIENSPMAAMHNFGGPVNMETLAMIPGFGTPTPGSLAAAPPILDTTPSPLSAYSPSPVSPWATAPPPYADPLQQQQHQHQQHHQQPPTAPMPIPMPMPASSAAAVAANTMSLAVSAPPQTHPLRFSEYCQLPEYVENNTWREQTLQTTTFKNSHFNVAHYNNPNFQPEEYKPESDDHHDAPPRASTRKRGSV
ncbi:peptidase C65 Otubain-domain-containing protein [Chaetomium sp. MPI-SDFR-AT-0129]|nr:peptidase C65 Otubain-domain-containing protein [Chaetomium sp. MPI-SDFR-AT-0129]